MDIQGIYQSVSSFWVSIAPTVFTHVLGVIVVLWAFGSSYPLLLRMEQFLGSERYRRWRAILDEFDLRSKLPFLFIILLIFYLVIFNDLLQGVSQIRFLELSYSETDFWKENQPFEVLEIANFSQIRLDDINQVYELKQTFVERYRSRFPEAYDSRVNWLLQSIFKWSNYYRLAILFVVFVLILIPIRVVKRGPGWKSSVGKLLLVTCFAVTGVVSFRYQTEQALERRAMAELWFILDQLNLDPAAEKHDYYQDEVWGVALGKEDIDPLMIWWSREIE